MISASGSLTFSYLYILWRRFSQARIHFFCSSGPNWRSVKTFYSLHPLIPDIVIFSFHRRSFPSYHSENEPSCFFTPQWWRPSGLFWLHDDVIKWKLFPRNWPFVRGIHRSPHKGQWRGALMFSLICVWIFGWVNNRVAGDLRRYRTHYDVTVMSKC